ncbi:hypothetical protein Clacol_008908 [Clathrus columnatus]|uniref:UspA domain-containing protein n=1 Tax=Clathrus columnatus TaxID=1419009 RepID=A0AAV5AJ12_9AGAM|nr:hypothetical protein Clacol_008908 [Clathrus columnatus]
MSTSATTTRPPSLNNSVSTSPTLLRPALKSSIPSTPYIHNGSLSEADPPQLDLNAVDPFPRTQTIQSTNSTATRRYTTKVGFDTFQNPTRTTLFSFTLQVKSEGYIRGRSTRSYLVAASGDESGIHALEWVMESLVQDGDEIIVFRGFDGEDTDNKSMRQARRDEAQDLMKWVLEKNDEVESGRKLFVIVEFVGGKVTSSIERLIALYRPDSLVVGSRARTVLQQWGAAFGAPGMGSVSRPERKVKKNNSKRRPSDLKRTFEG